MLKFDFNRANVERLARAAQVLADNQFSNPDIGPINRLASVDNFVISIPKSATTSIQRGFERLGMSVVHAHNDHTTYEAFPNGDVLRDNGVDLATMVDLRGELSRRPLNMFVGYREPVRWYLSLAGHFGLPLTSDLRDRMAADINGAYPWNRYGFADTLRTIEAATGARIFKKAFNARAGYSVLKAGRITIILYRADRMAELETYIRANIARDFEMRVDRANPDQAYVSYVRDFRVDRRTLERLYADPVHRFFFREEETAALIRHYSA